MINVCEGDMICDLAETYNILNYKELSPFLVATLVFGLRDNSRVKVKLSGSILTFEQIILTKISDSLEFLCWTKTESAQKNRNRPKPLLQKLLNPKKEKEDLKTFSTPQEYEEYMKHKREEWKNGK